MVHISASGSIYTALKTWAITRPHALPELRTFAATIDRYTTLER